MKYTLILLVFFFVSCETLLISEEIASDQQTVFEILWNDFDRNYAGFTVRSLDWDSVFAATNSAIAAGLSSEEFESIIANIILRFKDIHVALVLENREEIKYDASNPNSLNSIGLPRSYIDFSRDTRAFIWGRIVDRNIGYIWIPSFNEGIGLGEFERIDFLLNQLQETEGLVIDIRQNSGGSPAMAYAVVSRFITTGQVAAKSQLRNGPNHDDFDKPLIGTIEPRGPSQYLKPIVILMNRSSASAAELFVLPLELQANVTTIGDNTAGGLGANSYRELPNGWNYRFTTGLTTNAENVSYERTGIPPDEYVFITKTDSINGDDPQLERAIEILR